MLTIYKKDDTDFFQNINININTEQDLTSWTARVQLGSVVKSFSDISEKKIVFVLSSKDTAKLSEGVHGLYVKFTDNTGKQGSIDTGFKVKVLTEIVQDD